MTRIIQIKRGNAAQNNNFIGAAGEITMDTDAKTVRIHDGETLGGIPLARADLSNVNTESIGNCDSAFDIAAVPTDFWDVLFAAHGAAGGGLLAESALAPVVATGVLEYVFAGITAQKQADIVLVCQASDAGY
ncbi:MAG: hypothetical protein LBJ18_02640, partial [Rickettsiales bacterium]|nr:hypothetical protein [Rickettsiales bacterium]